MLLATAEGGRVCGVRRPGAVYEEKGTNTGGFLFFDFLDETHSRVEVMVRAAEALYVVLDPLSPVHRSVDYSPSMISWRRLLWVGAEAKTMLDPAVRLQKRTKRSSLEVSRVRARMEFQLSSCFLSV